MKPLIAAAMLALLSIAGADAQSAPPRDQRTDLDVRLQCRGEARFGSPRGQGRKAYLTACLLRERPGLIKADQCRQAGKSEGLTGPALNAHVRACRAAG